MSDTQFRQRIDTYNSAASEQCSRALLANFVLAIGLLLLGVANAAFHIHFPVVVAWLPPGLALACILLFGLRLLPGALLGWFLMMLAVVGDPKAAAISALAYSVACAVTWSTLRIGKPVDYANLTVGSAGRVLLTGCLIFGATEFILGPYSTSHLIKHVPTMQVAMPSHLPMAEAMQPMDAMQGHSSAHQAAPPRTSSVAHAAPKHVGELHAHTTEHEDVFEWLLTAPIGFLLMAPLMFYVSSRQNRPPRPMLERKWGATGVLFLLTTVTWSIYSGYLEDRFGVIHTTLLVLPFAVWLALEYDLGYTLIANFAVLLIAGIGTGFGHGPFKDHTTGLPLLTIVFVLTTLLIAASRTERRLAEQTIYRMATRDALTGIANRSFFNERMEQALYSARRYNGKLALMFIDLNDFKNVNDTLGHDAGDQLLVQVTHRIQGCMRVDSMLARFGGDEFVILVDHVKDTEILAAVADRIVDSVSNPYEIRGHVCHIACAIGISIFPDDGSSFAELMKKADLAMYRAKTSAKTTGQNSVQFSTAELQLSD